MLKIKSFFVLSIMAISQLAFAADTSGNFSASAELIKHCDIQVDDMNFGDVSLQTYVGSGDVTTSTNLNLRCTKDAAVNFTTNHGINGSGGGGNGYLDYLDGYGTDYRVYMVRHGSTSYVPVTTTNPTLIAEAVNLATLNGTAPYTTRPSTGWQNTTQQAHVYSTYNAGYAFTINYFIVVANTTKMANGGTYSLVNLDHITQGQLTPPPAASNMASGQNKIAYSLSTTPDGSVKLSGELSNPLTYNQNDGEFQTFPLYGFANFNRAPTGVYTDTNTITVDF